MCDISDLVGNCGGSNPPGLKTTLYLVAAEDIDTFPTTVSPVVNPEDNVTLDGDITLAASKAFASIDIIVNTGEGKDTLVGEEGGKSFDNTLEYMVQGAGGAQLAHGHCTANACLVGIYEDKAGVVRVIGSKDVPAKMDTIEITTAKKSGEIRGGTFVLKAESGHPMYVYTGTIDLTV